MRLETFDLPDPAYDKILAKVVCDSLCVSGFKAIKQGAIQKRVPSGIADNLVIIGHQFSGRLLKAGAKLKDKFDSDA